MKYSIGRLLCAAVLSAGGAAAWAGIGDPWMGRAAFLSSVALALWLSELTPLYVPTLLLWVGTPLLLGRAGPEFSLSSPRGWGPGKHS